MKIFLSVGTHRQQFDRLVKEIDAFVGSGKIKARVFGQIGNCNYKPMNFPFEKFVDDKEYEGKIKWADVVVGHAGAGLIISSLRQNKPLILVPRLKKWGEHTDDHQIELAEKMAGRKKAIIGKDEKSLLAGIKRAGKFRPAVKSDRNKLIKAIKGYLDGVKQGN